MKKDDAILLHHNETTRDLRPYAQPLHLAEVYEKEGPYDGQLLARRDRATYTFLSHKEVVILHYDRGRDEIFYNGHNLRHLHLLPEHLKNMEKFIQAMRSRPETAALSQSFEKLYFSFLHLTKSQSD